MIKWLFGDKADESVDTTKLSYAEMSALNKVTRFFSDRVPDPILREKIRALESAHQSFATDVLGDTAPSFETGAAYSHRIQVTKTAPNEWQIHKVVYLDLPKDRASSLAAVDGTAQPIPIGTAKCAFDALEFCAAFQAMAEKSGKTVLKDKNKEGGDFTHWRTAAEEAGQPTDIDGALIPCALGIPLLPSDSNRRFDGKQHKIMRKTAPKAKSGSSIVDQVSSIFKTSTASTPETVQTTPEPAPSSARPNPATPITYRDIGISNPSFFGSDSEPVAFLDFPEIKKIIGSRTYQLEDYICVDEQREGRSTYVERNINPDDYDYPILKNPRDKKKMQSRSIYLCNYNSSPYTFSFCDSIAYGFLIAMKRKSDGRYDLFMVTEAFCSSYVTKMTSGVSPDIAQRFIGQINYEVAEKNRIERIENERMERQEQQAAADAAARQAWKQKFLR